VAVAIATVLGACVSALAVLGVERYARRAERVSQAKVVLDRYRGPLRSAAWELGDRIDNFRVRGFLVYTAAGNPRTDQARASTAFRFEQYFRSYETLRSEVQVLNFHHDEDTRLLHRLLGHIVQVLASDKIDGTHAMLWADEQRAIGGLRTHRSLAASSVPADASVPADPPVPAAPSRAGQPSATAARVAPTPEVLSPALPAVEPVDEARAATMLDTFVDQALDTRGKKGWRMRFLQWALFLVVQLLDEEQVYQLEEESESRENLWMHHAREELTAPEPRVKTRGRAREMEGTLRADYTAVMVRLRHRERTRSQAAMVRRSLRVFGGSCAAVAVLAAALGAWGLLRADSNPSPREVADALNADARTFSTSCRRAGDDVFRCQTTTRDGRVADYRVVLGAGDCWLGHMLEAGSTAPRPRLVHTGCLDR
jgi:hypothetical protein